MCCSSWHLGFRLYATSGAFRCPYDWLWLVPCFGCLFMFVTIHVLGYEAETLQDIGDMARLQGKRIAFPGKVNPEARDCIVSFPGKYSKDPWHPLAILCFFPFFSSKLRCMMPLKNARQFEHWMQVMPYVLWAAFERFETGEIMQTACCKCYTLGISWDCLGGPRWRHWSCMCHEQHVSVLALVVREQQRESSSVKFSQLLVDTLKGPTG